MPHHWCSAVLAMERLRTDWTVDSLVLLEDTALKNLTKLKVASWH